MSEDTYGHPAQPGPFSPFQQPTYPWLFPPVMQVPPGGLAGAAPHHFYAYPSPVPSLTQPPFPAPPPVTHMPYGYMIGAPMAPHLQQPHHPVLYATSTAPDAVPASFPISTPVHTTLQKAPPRRPIRRPVEMPTQQFDPATLPPLPDDLQIPPPAKGDHDPGPRQLLVNYIPSEISDTELSSMFAKVGPVETAQIIRSEDGASRGYGFVYFKTSGDAVNAIRFLNKRRIGSNKVLKVSFAIPQRCIFPPGHEKFEPPGASNLRTFASASCPEAVLPPYTKQQQSDRPVQRNY